MDIRVGQWALFRGEWAFVAGIFEDDVILSGWRGLKTTTARSKEIKGVRDTKPHDLRRDRAGAGGWERFTCYSPDCNGATCLQRPYMNLEQWEQVKCAFFEQHPHIEVKPA